MARYETVHSTERVVVYSHRSVFWRQIQRSRGIGRPNHWPWFGYKVIMKDVEVVVAVNEIRSEVCKP